MCENKKYTVDEMFENYRRYSEQVERMCRNSVPFKVDFAVMKRYCRKGRLSPLRVSMVAAVLSGILFTVMPAADGYAMTTVVARQDKAENIVYHFNKS